MRETWVRSLGREDPLEKEMATHSSILAWRIPWTEEPGWLQSTGSPRVGHDWVTSPSFPFWTSQVVLMVKNSPANAGDTGDTNSIPESGRSPGGGTLKYSCLENSMDRGAWRATVPKVAKNRTWLKRLSTHACIPVLQVKPLRLRKLRNRSCVLKSIFLWLLLVN